MDWEPCQIPLQDLSAERAAMILAHKAMLNGSCLILACNHMGQGATHVHRKGIKLQSSPKKSFGLSKKPTNQLSSPGHLPLHTDQQKRLLSEFVFPPGSRREEEQIILLIKLRHLPQVWLPDKRQQGEPQCHMRPYAFTPSCTSWCFTRTLGRSVFGSLSTFSIAVRVSKPPTTLKEEGHDFQLSQHTQNIPAPLHLIYLIYAHYSSRFLNHCVWGKGNQQLYLEYLR